MIVQANSHIGFNCKNLEKSIQFYKEVVGLKENFRLYYGDMIPKNPEHRAKMDPQRLHELEEMRDRTWIVYLEWLDGYFIELFDEVKAHVENLPDDTKYGYTHFGIVVDDIEAFYQELVARGGEEIIDIPPQPCIDRNKSMWFHDPMATRSKCTNMAPPPCRRWGGKFPRRAEL